MCPAGPDAVPGGVNNARASLYFFSITVLCQLIGFGAFAISSDIIRRITGKPFPTNDTELALLLALHSFAAFSAARLIKLPLVWQFFNLLIAPAVILYPALGLPQWVLPGLAALSLLVYLPTLWTRVPYYPTPQRAYREVLRFIPEDKQVRVLDLGSGFGGLLMFLGRERPSAAIEGAEISPLPYLVSKLRVAAGGPDNVQITARNFWKIPFKDYDVIYCFLSPTPMEKLWGKVKQEMRPGTIFISNTFPVPAAAKEEIEIKDPRASRLFVYKL